MQRVALALCWSFVAFDAVVLLAALIAGKWGHAAYFVGLLAVMFVSMRIIATDVQS
jgi:hypothetical protein